MILLVDGTNLVMRYASVMVPRDTEPTTQQVNDVLRGCTRAIAECAQVVEATHLVVAFDASVSSWRRDLFPAYKAQRSTPTSVWSNRLNIHLNGRGVLCLREPRFEADDVLATLAMRAEKSGRSTAILSGDSDLLQLTTLLTRVVQFGHKGEPGFVLRSMQWIAEKYGIPSAGHLAAYKALVGEPGDNIPGVHLIGPVKAKKLLAVAESIDDIPKLLQAHEAEQYVLALKLVMLRDDVPLAPVHPAACRLNSQRMVTT